MNRWPLRYGVVLGFVGALVAFLASSAGGTFSLDRSPGTSDTSAASTTVVPSPFPAVQGEDVRAVRTGNGLVLPVIGGAPGAWIVHTPCAAEATVDGEPLHGANLVLDPGHGGSETGAIGPSGLTEAALNLDVAHRAAQLLEAQGADVVLTRTSDVRVTLRTRAEIATALQPQAFISVHHNASPMATSTTPGSEVYHQLASPDSKRLAGLLWEEYQRELAPFGSRWGVSDEPGALARRSDKTGDDYYGVLRMSHGVPAVLSEAAYISQPAEDALLNTEAFRAAEAKAIADAFVRFVTTDDLGSGFRPPKVIDAPAGGGGGTTGCEDPPLT